MEDSKENSTEIQELDALRIVSFLIRSKSSILIVPCLFAGLTIAANSLQFWMQRTKMRREVNCLFVMMKHLCIADLISGVCFLVSTLLIILEWKAFPSSTIILRIIDFVGRICTECLFGVSTVLLDFLILFKMLVASNRWYSKLTIRRICYSIWACIIVATVIGEILFSSERAISYNPHVA